MGYSPGLYGLSKEIGCLFVNYTFFYKVLKVISFNLIRLLQVTDYKLHAR